MKRYILIAFVIGSGALSAQNPANPFDPPGNPNPVPLDGGIALLLAAGGAAAYKKYKKEDV